MLIAAGATQDWAEEQTQLRILIKEIHRVSTISPSARHGAVADPDTQRLPDGNKQCSPNRGRIPNE
jgi:hypothetical protein